MKFKIIAVVCVIIICLAVLGACGWMDQLKAWKGGDEAAEPELTNIDQPIQQLPDQQQTPQENSEPNLAEQPTPDIAGEPQPDLTNVETREIVLYFASSDGEALEGEIRAIPKEEGMARATVNQLIAGPKIDGLMPTIPAATILEDINIKDGVCIVDFSEELQTDHPGGLKNEQLTVYSIVNTLSQFDSIDQVKILVDGKEIESLAGHVDVSEAMAPYDSLINK